MAISDLKRLLVPGALVLGGVTAGSLLAPVALASADDDSGVDTSDTTSLADAESDADTDSDAGEADGDHHHHRHGHGGMRGGIGGKVKAFAADVVTDTLGMTTDELRAALAEGKSLADVAADQGVSVDDLRSALLSAAEERIDDAVADGHLDEERAADIKAELADRIDEHLNRVHDGSMGDRHGKGRGFGRGFRGAGAQAGAEALADFLGVTTDDLRTAHQDGQTLAEIAEAQGVSEDDLVAFLMAQLEERLDTAVENGRLDADQVDDILAEAEARVEARINGEKPERLDGRGMGMGRGHRHSHADLSDGADA